MQDSDLRVCVAVRAIEAWFLSDTAAMQSFLHTSEFYEEFPEQENNPFERIKHWSQMFRGRGVQDKKILARNMVHNSNFSIENAAAHPNCHSAKYFIEKLKSLSTR
jgi:hypothetical protein